MGELGRRDWPPWSARLSAQLNLWGPARYAVALGCGPWDVRLHCGYAPLGSRLYETPDHAFERAYRTAQRVSRKYGLPRPARRRERQGGDHATG